jgi:HPt (histidine-containing phosphotransfer) domain-containing protein
MKVITNSIYQNKNSIYRHFNPDRMNKYLENDTMAIKEILLVVKVELKLDLHKLENCIYTQNLIEIKFISHKLFGTCATIGLERLSKIARELERQDVFNDNLFNQLFKRLKSESILAIEIMNSYIYSKSF